jgi:hypothetical protein
MIVQTLILGALLGTIAQGCDVSSFRRVGETNAS